MFVCKHRNLIITIPSTFRWYRARPALRIDGDIGEDALRYLHMLLARAPPGPALHLHGKRGPANSDYRGVAGHLVADENRTVKTHAGDGHGRGTTFGAARCHGAACQIH